MACLPIFQCEPEMTKMSADQAPLSEQLSDVHHHAEKWTEVSTVNPDTFPPHFLAFSLFQSSCHFLSALFIYPSCYMSSCSMDPALVPGVLFTLIPACNRVNETPSLWVHQTVGVILASLHGDRLHVFHTCIRSRALC